MNDKKQLETKLQEAFDSGFVPKDIRAYMTDNIHGGQVFVGDSGDDDRIKVGYRIAKLGGEEAHVFLYSLVEAEGILRDYK